MGLNISLNCGTSNHDFRRRMGNSGLYCPPVKGQASVFQAMLRLDGPGHSWDLELTMTTQPTENTVNPVKAEILPFDDWIMTDDDLALHGLSPRRSTNNSPTFCTYSQYVDSFEDREMGDDVADGNDEESFAFSYDSFQPQHESSESDEEEDEDPIFHEIIFDGGVNLGIVDDGGTFSPSVLYGGSVAAWCINGDSATYTEDVSLDLTSPRWEDLDLDIDTIEHNGELFYFPRVSGFPWEYYDIESRPLAHLFDSMYPALRSPDATRFEIVDALKKFAKELFMFSWECQGTMYAQNQMHVNLYRAAGCYLHGIDIAFYFVNRTKAARPYGLPARGKDFDKSVQFKNISSEDIKISKCRVCNMNTWTIKTDKYEVKLPNGKIKQETRKINSCMNPCCKRCKDKINSCMYCNLPLTREVREGWRADICTTFNCEQRFPRCEKHRRNMVYSDGDWECCACLKAEAALKRQEVEKEKKSEDAKPDRFENIFDKPTANAPSPKSEQPKLELNDMKEFPPLPQPEKDKEQESTPTSDEKQEVQEDPKPKTEAEVEAEKLRLAVLDKLQQNRAAYFARLNERRAAAGLSPINMETILAARAARIPQHVPPCNIPPPKTSRPLASQKRKLKKIPTRSIPKVIQIDPITATHTSWHWNFDWCALLATCILFSVFLPLYVALAVNGLLDNFVMTLVILLLSIVHIQWRFAALVSFVPYLLNYSWFLYVENSYGFVCLPNPIRSWVYYLLGTSCAPLVYSGMVLCCFNCILIILFFCMNVMTKEYSRTRVTVYKKFEYLRPYVSTHKGDTRVDAVSIGDIKHGADYGIWKVHTPVRFTSPRRWYAYSAPQVLYYKESEEFIVSNELMRQLISIDKIHHASKPAVACEILLRSAARNTTINIDKYIALETGQSVSSNTVNLALAWLTQLKQTDPVRLLNQLAAQPERESS